MEDRDLGQLSLEGVEHFAKGGHGSGQDVICLAQRTLASMSQKYFCTQFALPVGCALHLSGEPFIQMLIVAKTMGSGCRGNGLIKYTGCQHRGRFKEDWNCGVEEVGVNYLSGHPSQKG